ncbi:glucosamine-6-phosphate deaminase [Paenibacillus selenitireducens]|uniref:Glucosamine-6-phosphate deaminase n=2 Tax=Paenibacillus selenitireducens TaxID=1324314 RepID=A0A1T2X0L5_9BACL|nr:glucosamine-6-phosphate deaminase [Paenibacillus selenitireducens]OPA73410.1 glucosamine-6-phosphate deaminase [Paenibacillus selenitireducens]
MTISSSPIRTMQVDNLRIEQYADRRHMGAAAAAAAAQWLKQRLASQNKVRVIFAAAPSQNEFLEELIRYDLDWSRIVAFHMDEYIGLPVGAPQSFAHFLNERLLTRVPFGEVHTIHATEDGAKECARYTSLLQEAPIDAVCLGIGENGHIAFNDPPVADFNDPHTMKVVELDEMCRIQQVNDGCFPNIKDVPTYALTLTILALMAGQRLFCIVPGPTKRRAVTETLHGPINTSCPASLLRTHPSCTLFVDQESLQPSN